MVKLQANINLVDYKGLNPSVRKFLEGRNLSKTAEVSLKEKDIELD